MSSTADRFKHESLEDPESIVKYLLALKEGFDEGALMFSSDERRLTVKPSGLINMEIEARRQGDDVRLTLRFRWSEATRADETRQGALTIQSATKP